MAKTSVLFVSPVPAGPAKDITLSSCPFHMTHQNLKDLGLLRSYHQRLICGLLPLAVLAWIFLSPKEKIHLYIHASFSGNSMTKMQ